MARMEEESTAQAVIIAVVVMLSMAPNSLIGHVPGARARPIAIREIRVIRGQ
jgi:hypothetical protein